MKEDDKHVGLIIHSEGCSICHSPRVSVVYLGEAGTGCKTHGCDNHNPLIDMWLEYTTHPRGPKTGYWKDILDRDPNLSQYS